MSDPPARRVALRCGRDGCGTWVGQAIAGRDGPRVQLDPRAWGHITGPEHPLLPGTVRSWCHRCRVPVDVDAAAVLDGLRQARRSVLLFPPPYPEVPPDDAPVPDADADVYLRWLDEQPDEPDTAPGDAYWEWLDEQPYVDGDTAGPRW